MCGGVPRTDVDSLKEWLSVRVGLGVPRAQKDWKMEVWRLSQELIPSRKLDIHVQFLWHLYQKIRPQFIAHGVADAMILTEIESMSHAPFSVT